MLSTFWCHQIVAFPLIAKKALEILMLFLTMYLCEQSFSKMVDIKMKKRNRLCCKNDLGVALARVKLCISELVSERQQQKSHWFSVLINIIFWRNHISFFQLWRVRWMLGWNLWGSVPPTRLRTTDIEKVQYSIVFSSLTRHYSYAFSTHMNIYFYVLHIFKT